MPLSNDTPISQPTEDLFGLDSFAKALASNIEKLSAPEGTVLAVNGPWGSGKSSAINLMKCHLADAITAGNIQWVTFNPWWFAGSDALTMAFFQQLKAAIGPSLPEKAQKAFSAIGTGVSAIGQVVAAAVDLKAPGIGGLLGSVFSFVGERSKGTRTVEEEHQVLVDALRKQEKRFLVVIDDIDRLNPDDALNIFRLVKSVGRLPNVIYLLAFDRTLAERLVAERFPSEGPSYLEKIIQTAFEVPPPLIDELRQQLLSGVLAIIGQPAEADGVRLMNVFYDVIAPLLDTPRDMVRLISEVAATWPSVSNNVDRADFLALAAIRLFAPEIYKGIRDNPTALCGMQAMGGGRNTDAGQRYLEMLNINQLSAQESARWQQALRRLFPKLEAIWGNVYYQDDQEWQRQRRICSQRHFRTYFSYTVPDDVVPAEEMQQLLTRADEIPFVQDYMRENIRRLRRNGKTRASLVLDELIARAPDIEETKVEAFLSAIFSLGDELDIVSDEERGFSIGNNPLRIHWLCNRITEGFDETRKDAIYEAATEFAPVGWLCDFADRCSRLNDPNRQAAPSLVSVAAAERLIARSSAKLREVAENGELANNSRLGELLFTWNRLPNGVVEVRQWTDRQLENNTFIINMAKTMTSQSWSQGMGLDGNGDRVARINIYVNEASYRDIVDIPRLTERVNELLATKPNLPAESIQILNTYRDAPRRDPRRLGND